ncbi:ras GEF [Cylindrobasidium torrendii FP15055 ss-10]|uniref:Ras GEF n=1 Tax=Cylindrobasidium torrendii FP15055 ss-10 TaxID=1314674 RepID=A0A0D7BSB0_9AGAR|nr:ras GEF [Cylindrobasidium torrendii FP15055 ss-10]
MQAGTHTSMMLDDDSGEEIPTFWCRALYDYTAQDSSALSFHIGDIIEVFSQQDSGWWDGFLGEERGWFPSNYVQVIPDEEAEALLEAETPGPEDVSQTNGHAANSVGPAANGYGRGNGHQPRESIVDMSTAMMGGAQGDAHAWLERDLGPNALSGLSTDTGSSKWDNGSSSSDFWMPSVAPNGQIFYVNTKTGEQSRDLPQEAEDDLSDTDLSGLAASSSSRTAPNAFLEYSSDSGYDPAHSDSDVDGPMAGFGLQRRSGTPEPWIKKLADDGMAYFYLNTLDGTISWTRPEAPSTARSRGLSTSARPTASPSGEPVNRLSVYSDSSDVLDPSLATRTRDAPPPPPQRSEPQQPYVDTIVMELTTAEKIAQELQKQLAPRPPEKLGDLAIVVKNTTLSVVGTIQGRGANSETIETLIDEVVTAVRNLLYVSTAPLNAIAPNVLPPSARDLPAPPDALAVLKPAQRKVTATLSRLVLSTRAIQYDSVDASNETIARINADADELERAVLAFVLEAQRTQHSAAPDTPSKRLDAYFGTANLGLGLVGGGAAGLWQGFGYVTAEAGPRRREPQPLSADVLFSLSKQITRLDSFIQEFGDVLRQVNLASVLSVGRDIVTTLSNYLAIVGDIHVARHVDIDGMRQESNHVANEAYVQTVINARSIVRALECFAQSAFDESMSFFVTLQSWQPSEVSPEVFSTEVDAILPSLHGTLVVIQQSLDALLDLGNSQAELGQADYRENIGRRLSRLSVIGEQFGGPSRGLSTYMEEMEDVVDMDYAFGRRPMVPPKAGPSDVNAFMGHRAQPSIAPSIGSTTVIEEDDEYDEPDAQDDVGLDDDVPRPQTKGRQKDLAKILGPGFTSESQPLPEPAEIPWYLRPTYNAEEILIDTDGSIKGGTLPALVERLTAHEQSDPTYVKTFLMTFKSFTTVQELYTLLVERFRIKPPPELMGKDLENWAKMKQHVIQARVLNIFKSLVVDDDYLDKEDLFILDQIKQFASSDDTSHFAAAKQLVLHVDRAKIGDRTRIVPVNMAQAPQPITPKLNKGRLKMLEIEPLEMARQLTIMESNLFQRIRPIECLQRAREGKAESQDNITLCIHASNKIADWVADLILSKEDSRRRAATVKHLITVADRCRTLNNFSTMIAITSGLNTPHIRRLKRTWEQVNQRAMAQFGACEMTIDSNKNFTRYRQLMATITPPCVPFIGVFLSTLQFIQDGNPDTLPGGLINFRKRQRASEVISDIQRWQAQSFNFVAIPVIQKFIDDNLSRFNDKSMSDIFWDMSLEREPREREDEKMARLLQESGFL